MPKYLNYMDHEREVNRVLWESGIEFGWFNLDGIETYGPVDFLVDSPFRGRHYLDAKSSPKYEITGWVDLSKYMDHWRTREQIWYVTNEMRVISVQQFRLPEYEDFVNHKKYYSNSRGELIDGFAFRGHQKLEDWIEWMMSSTRSTEPVTTNTGRSSTPPS